MASRSLVAGLLCSLHRIVLVSACLLALCFCENHEIVWTPDGVRMYNATNPLDVVLGDQLFIECPADGNYAFSNVWILQNITQYEQCDCMAEPGLSCDPIVDKNGQCIQNVPSSPKLPIINNDAHLNSVYNFLPGRTYYLVSFVSEQSTSGALSEDSSGGQCSDGLRMAFSIAMLPTEPITTTQLQNATTTDSMDSSMDSIVDVSTPTTNEPSTTIARNFTTITKENLTTTAFTSILLLPSVAIRDWHILIIALLGTALVSLLVLYVIASLIFVFYRRRRGRDVVDPESKVEQPKYTPHPEKAEKKAYPEMFVDPLDRQD